jgi:adenylyltransferase/sulfurtransferase
MDNEKEWKRYDRQLSLIGKRGIPLIHGAIRAFYGQTTTFLRGKIACLRCLFLESPAFIPPFVIGPTCGFIGYLQATGAIKIILDPGSLLENRLLLFDGLRRFQTKSRSKRGLNVLTAAEEKIARSRRNEDQD